MEEDNYEFIKNIEGFRLVHKVTGENFGKSFQEKVRSIEFRSAFTVYRKYKNKMGLEYKDLLLLIEFAKAEVRRRKEIGKNTNMDYLTQLCSSEIKRLNKENIGVGTRAAE